jgi:hypothetical protein
MSALPPNAINADEFNMDDILPTTHLFFDDVINNIVDVQTAVNKLPLQLQLQLQSVHCPGDSLLLYYDDADTKDNVVSINNVNDYVKLKHMDPDPEFKNFKPSGGEVGPGITNNMIQQIISYEEANPSSGRIYFFDFDRVLNQLGGLDFSFLNSDPNVDTDMNPYARFLFSDHIQPNNNTTMDRFNLLKRMFMVIPPDRVYVVTANSFADASNPYSRHFLNIVKTLNPDFIPTHLIFSRQKSVPIVSILQSAVLPLPLPLPLAVPRSAKPLPKPLPVSKSAKPLTKSVITRSAMPFINPVTRMTRSVRSARPVRPIRPVIRPRLMITTKRKGGARRRSKFLHTRRRRIVT